MKSILGPLIPGAIRHLLLCGQTASYKPPRMADGHPNLNGIWEALNTANWNLQDHPAYAGPHVGDGCGRRRAVGQGRRRRQRDSLQARSRGEEESQLREPPHGRSRSQVLHAWNTARQLHALSVPDCTNQQGHSFRVRVRDLEPADQHGQAYGSPVGHVDGHEQRSLGRRHAGDRRDRSEWPRLVGSRREFRQRQAACRRALDAAPIAEII